jgi:hypothetical protein
LARQFGLRSVQLQSKVERLSDSGGPSLTLWPLKSMRENQCVCLPRDDESSHAARERSDPLRQRTDLRSASSFRLHAPPREVCSSPTKLRGRAVTVDVLAYQLGHSQRGNDSSTSPLRRIAERLLARSRDSFQHSACQQLHVRPTSGDLGPGRIGPFCDADLHRLHRNACI